MKLINKKDKLLNKTILLRLFNNKLINLAIMILIFFLTVFFTMYYSISLKTYDLKVGETAPTDIKAPIDIEDKEATAKQIKKAIESVEPKSKLDPTIQIDIKKKVEKFFKSLYETRELYKNGDMNLKQSVDVLKNYGIDFEEKDLDYLIKAQTSEVESIESYVYEVIIQVMSTGINEEELDTEKEKITEYFQSLEGFTDQMKIIAITLVNNSIKANSFFDEDLTQEKIDEAIKKVDKVFVKKGQIIVSEGEIIGESQYRLLIDAGLVNNKDNNKIAIYLGLAILILILEFVILAYIYFLNKKLIYEISKLYLIMIVFLIIFLIAKPISSISEFLVPVATASMLIGILVNPYIAIIINLVLTTMIVLLTGSNIIVYVTLIISGTLGAISASNTHQRSNIFLSGVIVAFANLFIISSLGFINDIEIKKILIDGFYGILNGILCSILTIGSLPLWEYLFRILTPIKLLELSNPNHPLLKRMLMEAPGTYHHSIIVGNLSESAAQAIGANSLLARVSAYYHDIGKLMRPYFFKENQITSDNPHDKLTAKISATIIKNHVKDGVSLALKYNLPKEIIDIIQQHHGTTLIKYFYHKAISKEDKSNPVDSKIYKYEGPKPKTKESAIVLISDSVEAAVRCLPEPTKENISQLVNKIIDDKIEAGQLNDCNLTFNDIETIKIALINTLLGIFHERIEYPEINEEELEVSN